MESLSFYNVESAAVVTTLALGSCAPSSSDDRMLSVHNNSDLYLAQDVSVTVTGGDNIQLWLSTDSDTFTPTIHLGDIPPGGLSTVFWLRRVTASTEAAGSCTANLEATPTAWAGS
jgi:hypothetical protein